VTEATDQPGQTPAATPEGMPRSEAPTAPRPPAPSAASEPRGAGRVALWTRVVAAIAVFAIIAVGGIIAIGTFGQKPDPDLGYTIEGANSFALIFALALVGAFVVYALLEYSQTGGIPSIASQFDTRTIVLMPIAIAFNIVMGQAVGAAIKIPIYLDSIGTILVGALAGPIAGALTGFLSNILWNYVVPPPFHNDYIGAFAIVAAVIGLLAGTFARAGWLRPRPDRTPAQLAVGAALAITIIFAVGVLAYLGYTKVFQGVSLAPASDNTVFLLLGWAGLALIVVTVVGLLYLLFRNRDLTASYVVVAGMITGVIAAAISAPISANVFGGVTGAGTDFLVAAFRQAGGDIQSATLGQGLISDPIDKITTFFVVYLILNAMGRRLKARFPQGERLVEAPGPELTRAPHAPPPATPPPTTPPPSTTPAGAAG
jgi:energy-coupling factor transport system substrate-specific component